MLDTQQALAQGQLPLAVLSRQADSLDWRRVEHDEDGLEVYHEYRLRFCPNCGMKIKGGDDNV